MSDKEEEARVIDKYTQKSEDSPKVSGEEVPVPVAQTRWEALEDNPDGSVTVHLAVETLSASVKTPISGSYGKILEPWTHMTYRPMGNWHVTFRLKDRKTAESMQGVVDTLEGGLRLMIDMQRLFVEIKKREDADKVPGQDVPYNR